MSSSWAERMTFTPPPGSGSSPSRLFETVRVSVLRWTLPPIANFYLERQLQNANNISISTCCLSETTWPDLVVSRTGRKQLLFKCQPIEDRCRQTDLWKLFGKTKITVKLNLCSFPRGTQSKNKTKKPHDSSPTSTREKLLFSFFLILWERWEWTRYKVS